MGKLVFKGLFRYDMLNERDKPIQIDGEPKIIPLTDGHSVLIFDFLEESEEEEESE